MNENNKSLELKKCSMCLELVESLELSHFIPKLVYRRMRKMLAPEHDLNMADNKKKTFKLSREIKNELFCKGCEDKLNKNGERYFANICLPVPGRDGVGHFTEIAHAKVIPLWNNTGGYNITLGSGFLPGIDMNKIYYFAISIFWRGSFNVWNNYEPLNIDEPTRERMRLFLLNPEKNKIPYRVYIAPSFWKPKYGTLLPVFIPRRKHYLFSILWLDFYLFLNNKTEQLSGLPISLMANQKLCIESFGYLKKTIVEATPCGNVNPKVSWL
ncbi:hypothetical protein PZA20_00830 [Pectobacterium polaris]|uniref:hypothetical protein n=1 Tax=Pectobacterium polaris TaxID=2042057 RepID=UPI0023AF88DD|nr:hypothetical protein [Pectobacterium polaris]MDE8740375.1 hypothetical protein [Pectobacterium polaris]